MTKYLSPPDRIRSHLSYDQESGGFVWIAPLSRSIARGSRAGSLTDKGYRLIRFGGRIYTAGRLAWWFATGESPDALIDHINGDRDDNRIANLRPATFAQNSGNQRGWGSFKKGVSQRKDRKNAKFIAKIGVGGKKIILGRYATEDEAHAAYCEAAVKYYGAFARFE